jgi:hypothetical protein
MDAQRARQNTELTAQLEALPAQIKAQIKAQMNVAMADMMLEMEAMVHKHLHQQLLNPVLQEFITVLRTLQQRQQTQELCQSLSIDLWFECIAIRHQQIIFLQRSQERTFAAQIHLLPILREFQYHNSRHRTKPVYPSFYRKPAIIGDRY